jgi:thermitase
MRRFARPTLVATLTALLLTGCSRGASLTAVGVPQAAPAAEGPRVTVRSEAPKVVLPEEADGKAAVPDEIIVRFDGQARPIAGATLKRPLDLPNTYVYAIAKQSYSVQAVESWEDAEDIVYVEPNYLYTTTLLGPNDPQFADSWGVADVKAPQAWATSTGAGIKVAVIDTGVNPNHPDLAGQVLQGADLVNNDNDATDDHGHGTHVAGTVSAIANNLKGVAGVAPDAKIIPIKVLAANGSGKNDDIAEGILKAAALGAKVINMSLGGPDNSQTLEAAIAQVQRQGVIVIAAAGNDNVNTPFYPAANEGVIGVGAVDSNHRKASFSNYGDYLDICAPGVSIGSTGFQGNYTKLSGTSMASPHVAGAAAVLLAAHPNLKAAQISRLLNNTGKATTGFGMTNAPRTIDVAAALEAAPTMDLTPPTRVTGVVATPGAPGEVTLRWAAASDNVGVAGYRVFRNGESLGTTAATSFSDAGLKEGQSANYTVSAYDADGNEGALSQAVAGKGGLPSTEIEGLTVAKRGTKDLTITWTTKSATRCYLQWGTAPQLTAGTAPEAQASTTHSVTLSNLSRFKNYHFRVVATDARGDRHYSATKKARTKLWFLFGS